MTNKQSIGIEFNDYEWSVIYEGSAAQKTNKLYLHPILTKHAPDWNDLEKKESSWDKKLSFLFEKKYIRASDLEKEDNSTIIWQNAPMKLSMALYVKYSDFFLEPDLSVLKEVT